MELAAAKGSWAWAYGAAGTVLVGAVAAGRRRLAGVAGANVVSNPGALRETVAMLATSSRRVAAGGCGRCDRCSFDLERGVGGWLVTKCLEILFSAASRF